MRAACLSALALASVAQPAMAEPVFAAPAIADTVLAQQRGGADRRWARFAISESYVIAQWRMTADLRSVTFDNWFAEQGSDLIAQNLGAQTMIVR